MTNRKNTKRALFSSVLALILCFTMLLGSTYAWFTDSATTTVNTIQAGTLDVDLVDATGVNSLVGATLKFQKLAGHENEDLLWEPGASYKLEQFMIKNKGNLALKYQIVVNGVNGDAKLLEAIDWTATVGNTSFKVGEGDADGIKDLVLKAGQTSSHIQITGTMKKEAGNEYQGLSLDGISITVLATQATVEHDSFGNTYDAGAEYAEVVPVANASELAEALLAGKGADLTAHVAIPAGTVIKIPADANVTINLNGKTLDASAQDSRPFELADGTQLTINAENATIKTGDYGLVNVPANTKDTAVVLNGGTYTATTDNGAFIKVRDNAEADVTLNNVTYTDTSADGWIMNASGANTTSLTIKKGKFEAAYGLQATNINITGAEIKTGGLTIEVKNDGVATITNTIITNTGTVHPGNITASAVAVGYGAVAHVEGGKVTAPAAAYAFTALPGTEDPDGAVYVTNCEYTGMAKLYDGATGKIVVNGQLMG